MISDGNLYALLNPVAAFVAGAVVSLHCVGMCGPLSCRVLSGGNAKPSWSGHGMYHLGRAISYIFLGSVAGFLGANAVTWLGDHPARFAPWVMAAFFLALALNLDTKLTRWQAKSNWGRRFVQKAYRLSGYKRGLGLGLVTPLIPCGPLYLMLWASALSGSAWDAAVVMACFALGTMPLSVAAQSGFAWISSRLGQRRATQARRIVAFLAFAVICVRAFLDTGAEALLSGEGICS